MDDKVNHTLVGAFVLALGAALVVGVLWLSAGVGGQRTLDRYQAVIEESVAGLNLDAPVKYLGVDVGKVSRIEIDPTNSQQVRLQFLIERGTPIKTDSEAVLKTQGLTGIAYIELSGGSAAAAPLVGAGDGMPPTITFRPSLTARLENVLSNVLANIDRTSGNINDVFDADNRAALKALLADTAAVAQALAAQRGTMTQAMNDAARTARLTAQAGEELAPKLERTLERISASAAAVERMAQTAGQASERAGAAADATASSVQQLASETLPELARLMTELGQLSVSLRRFTEQTADSPSSLLTGSPAPRPGPGEEARP